MSNAVTAAQCTSLLTSLSYDWTIDIQGEAFSERSVAVMVYI